MKYKLLKLIEPKENSISIGGTFDSIGGFVHLDNGLQLSVELLIEQGFIEEVKETLKPRWRVGDNVVLKYAIPEYFRISMVYLSIDMTRFLYDRMPEDKLRDPTPEELSLYFK